MKRFVYGAVAMCVLSAAATAADHTTDSLETVKKPVSGGKAILVDVREEGEWKDGHIKNARHLALSDLKAGIPAEKLKKILPTGSTVYLHCASGKRCLAAADLLKKHGYDVRPLKDGFESLVKDGFPQDK